jgi:murein L,D-transpeptidase YafK
MPYFLFLILMMFQQNSFKEIQLSNSRVKQAYDEKEPVVKKYFADKKLSYPGFNLFLRAFKREQKLEVWIREQGDDTFRVLTTYGFCSSSGVLGPKRKEGDLQIPEGFYHINHFNPQSNFHLSLGINYPNASDRILSDKKRPGSAIYIHGNCVTIGCIPITDELIKELYVLATEARNNRQEKIPVHIFPSRLDAHSLAKLEQDDPSQAVFWRNLAPIYQEFEKTKKLPGVGVEVNGQYSLK